LLKKQAKPYEVKFVLGKIPGYCPVWLAWDLREGSYKLHLAGREAQLLARPLPQPLRRGKEEFE
jgi:hypothetical protein